MTNKKDANKSLDSIELKLDQYLVKYPDDYKIDETIDTLRQYVPEKNKRFESFNRLRKLINYSKKDIFFIRKSYWIINIIIFALGYFITSNYSSNPLLTIISLGPIPFIIGLTEVFKGRDKGLLEMEMTCKFSANEIMLLRLLIVSIFNITLNTLLTVAFLPLLDTTNIFKVILLWSTPFTLFTSVALLLSMKIKGNMLIVSLFALWAMISGLTVYDPIIGQIILSLHIAWHLLFLIIGTTILVFQIKALVGKYSSYEEGLFEINN